ncbi:MAG: flagellar export chaperone FlgN [Phycisphaerales bacterium]|nr:flagellar export chaperone FlgN [Phycisphaerales bacterium]
MKLADHTHHARSRRTQAPKAAGAIDTDKLDSFLGQLEDEHTHLLELAKAHKDAITHASLEELNSITMQTSDVLMRIAQIEDDRQQMITQNTGALTPLDQLIEQFDDKDRERIGHRRTRLRELILRVQEEQNEVRLASENLGNHMRAMIKQVGASLSHAGTYSRGGGVAPSRSQVISSLDLVQ